MIIAFTGHRPNKIGGYSECLLHQKIKDVIKRELEMFKPTKIISGMALGVDQLAVQVALSLNIPVIAACPCPNQEIRWPYESKAKYQQLLERCSEIRHISESYNGPWTMQVRNEWMVDNSDMLVAIFDGSSGGTKNCVDYAKKQSKNLVIIDPRKL